MIGLTVDAGDHLKNRAALPLAPCTPTELKNMCEDASVFYLAKIKILEFAELNNRNESTSGWCKF
jgi:hypothetical protein